MSIFFFVLGYLCKSAVLRKNLVAINQMIIKILFIKKSSTAKFNEVLIEAHNDLFFFFILFYKFRKIITFSLVHRIKTMVCSPIFEPFVPLE